MNLRVLCRQQFFSHCVRVILTTFDADHQPNDVAVGHRVSIVTQSHKDSTMDDHDEKDTR
jgi:hypothetical protein